MNRCSMFVLLTLACLLAATPSWAAWKLVSTGTATGMGNPSCALAKTNLVACAVQSGKATIMVNQFNGTSWGTWTSLAGTVTSAPNCTGDGSGNVFCASNSAGNMLVTVFNGSTWSTPAKVLGAIYSAPGCANYLKGEVLCVATNASGNLGWSLYSGGKWSKFANLKVSTSAFSAPSCTNDNNNGVVCAVFTEGYAMLVNRFAAGAWAGFLNLSGATAGTPDCTSVLPPGDVACYVEAYNSGIYANVYNGTGWKTGNWGGYIGLSGEVNANASCTAQAPGEQLCGAYGVGTLNSEFGVNVYNGSSWSGWSLIGGTGVGTPSCAPLGNGQVVCAIMQGNNQLTSAVGP